MDTFDDLLADEPKRKLQKLPRVLNPSPYEHHRRPHHGDRIEWWALLPPWVQYLLKRQPLWNGITWKAGEDSGDFSQDDDPGWTEDSRQPTTILEGAEVVSSAEEARRGNYHYVMLDIDHEIFAMPSSTDGHYHLYIDHAMTEEDYFKLLDVMGEVGLLEEGYVKAAKVRGATFLRLPWIGKGTERADAATSLQQMLDETDPPT